MECNGSKKRLFIFLAAILFWCRRILFSPYIDFIAFYLFEQPIWFGPFSSLDTDCIAIEKRAGCVYRIITSQIRDNRGNGWLMTVSEFTIVFYKFFPITFSQIPGGVFSAKRSFIPLVPRNRFFSVWPEMAHMWSVSSKVVKHWLQSGERVGRKTCH